MAEVTPHDLIGSALAVVAFGSVLYVPGYLLGFGTDLFGFRRMDAFESIAWSLALSFVSVPITGYFVGRYAGFDVFCWMFVPFLVAFAAVHLRGAPRLLRCLDRRTLALGSLAVIGTGFVLLSLVDVQSGGKLYFSVVEFDQSYRVAFTNAVLRTGVPPANPLFFCGHLAPMRYYYFWYVLCAAVARIAHVSAQQAFVASSVWSGFGLVAVIALSVRHFSGVGKRTRAHTAIAVGLLAVTGADMVPAIGSLFAQPALNGEMEWWSIDQFYSWQDSVLWVPHHTAALLSSVTAFLLLWRTQEAIAPKQRLLAAALAGVAFASAFGLSVYVAFGFALLMLAWIAFLARDWRRQRALIGRVLLAGVAGALAIAPFLHDLTAGQSTTGDGASAHAAHLFSFSIRRMIDPELVTTLPALRAVHHTHPFALDVVVRLLLLLPGLALELGVYGAVYGLLLYARWRSPEVDDSAHDTSLFLTGCGLLMVLFLRSSVISNNDFAYRASLLPQFFLLLLTADLLASWWSGEGSARVAKTPKRRRLVYALLGLGVMSSVYQAAMLRLFLPIEEHQPGSGFARLPAEAYQVRQAMGTLNRTTPKDSVVAFNPADPKPTGRGDVVSPYTFFERAILMDAHRQLLNAEPTCAAEFGGDAGACAAIDRATERLYAMPALPVADAREFCNRFGVTYLVASSLDPVWSDPAGWVNTLPVLDAEPDLRIVRCSP